MILVSSTFSQNTRRACLTGGAAGLAFGLVATGASLPFGGPADLTRGLGWLVLVLGLPIGAALGPMAVEQGFVPALLAALWATILALPLGALLYTLALGLTTGQGGADLVLGALAAALFGVLVAGVPLGGITFVAASVAIVIVRLIVLGPSNLVGSYAGLTRSRANR